MRIRKHAGKKLLSLLMSVTLLAGLLPANNAGAEPATEGDTEHATEVIMVNLDKAEGANKVLKAGNESQPGASFDPDKGILTLTKGVSEIAQDGYVWLYEFDTTAHYEQYAAIYAKGDLIIEIANEDADPIVYDGIIYRGANPPSSPSAYSIYVDGNLTIRNKAGKNGDAAFKSTEEGSATGGIFCSGKLTVEGQTGGSLKVDTIARKAKNNGSNGIYAGKGIDVTNATITSTGGEGINGSKSYGIYAGGPVNVGSGGKISATGGKVADTSSSVGIFATNDITVESGGEIVTTGGVGRYSSGLEMVPYKAEGETANIVVNGILKAQGTEGSTDSVGISFGSNNIDIIVNDGGKVEAAGGITDGKSYGIISSQGKNIGITVNNGGTLNASGGKAEKNKGESYGIYLKDGKITLNDGSVTTSISDYATRLSAGVYIYNGIMIDIADRADYTFGYVNKGTTGSYYNICYQYLPSAVRELTCYLMAEVDMGLYLYETKDGYKLDLMRNHKTETDWGIEDHELYEYLTSLDEALLREYSFGAPATLKELLGEDMYNVPEDIVNRYDIYALDRIDAVKIQEGKLDADKAELHKLGEAFHMTKDIDYSLCFIPKMRVTYKSNGTVLDNNDSIGIMAGEDTELEYETVKKVSADDITVMAFTVDDTSKDSVIKALAKGNDSKTVKIENDAKNNTLTVCGVTKGTGCILAVNDESLNSYQNKEITADEFMQKAGCLFVNVSEAKTYTVSANGGRFIKSYLVRQFKEGYLADFADIYDKGYKTLTFNAPAKCTWGELYDYMKKELLTKGYSFEFDYVPFRYGYTRDDLYCLLPHEGSPTKSEPSWKLRSTDAVPSDCDTVYIPYEKSGDCTMYFYNTDIYGKEATIVWDDDMPFTVSGNKYTAPKYSRFTFPEAKRDGYVFLGWRRNDYVNGMPLMKAGTTGFVDSYVSYRPVFDNTIDRIDFDGIIPDEIEAGAEVGYYTSLGYYGDEELTIYNEQLHESMEIGADGNPASPQVETIATDRGHVYYLMIKIHCSRIFDPDKTEIYINDKRVGVEGDGIKLFYLEDKECFYIIKKYTVGNGSPDYNISFDTAGKAELPDSLKGIVYSNGDTLEYILDAEDVRTLFNLTYTENGKTYKAHWYPNKALRAEEEIYKTTALNYGDNITLYADWVEQKQMTSVDISIPLPAPGTYLNKPSDDDPKGDVFDSSWMSGSNEEISWNCYDIRYYNDGNYYPIKDKTEFIQGKKYEVILSFTANEKNGYSFDDMDLPMVTINGKQAQLELFSTDDGYGHVEILYVAIFDFTPKYKTYSLTLDYNYPDGTVYTHTITDIPSGTGIKESAFDLGDALYIGNMSYDDYLKLADEYNDDGKEAFYAKHKRIEPKEIKGYRDDGYGPKKTYNNIKELYSGYLDGKKITEDTILYVTWQKELDSVHLNNINTPVCGTSVGQYKEEEDFGIEFENGVDSGDYSWMNEDHSAYLDDDHVFKGGDKVSLHMLLGLDDAMNKAALFDRYITKDTKVRYNGKEYSASEFEDDNMEIYIPITVEHAYSSSEGTSTITNEVLETCETEGSYDEVRSFTCMHCHKSISDTIHHTIPARGHDLAKHVLTEPVNGITTYWECERCHKLFADDKGNDEIKFQATVRKAPEAVKGLEFKFRILSLIKAGQAENGEMYYALGDDDKTEPDESSYSKIIPEASDAGTYYVWYMAKGEGMYGNSDPKCITVKIAEMDISDAEITFESDELIYNGQEQEPVVTDVLSHQYSLIEGESYEVVSGSVGSEVGTYTYKIKGIGNCTGTASATWKIVSPGTIPTFDPGTEPTPPAGNPTTAPSGTPSGNGNDNQTTPGQNGSLNGNGTGATPGQNGSQNGSGSSTDAGSDKSSSTKKIKISKIKAGKKDKELIVKISVKGVTIKVKIGKDTYKAKLGKKKNSYTFKLKKPLKNKAGVVITVTKKGYKKLKQKYTYNKKKFKKAK